MTIRHAALRAAMPAALLAATFALAAAPAHATVQPLVAGQTISLPLNEETDGPTLKVTVKSAVGGSSIGLYATLPQPNETKAERKARGLAVPLDSIDGRNLVKFVRATSDELRGRAAGQASPRSVVVNASFVDKTRIDQGHLWGDALKAGFTLGLANSATTPLYFVSHIDVTVDNQTFSCDAEAPGRIPTYPRKNDPHAHDALDKMAEDARKACWAQISDKVGAAVAGPAAVAAPAAPEAAPAAAVAPSTPTS